MIMAAIAVAATVAGAATVTWGSGTVFGPSDANGTMGSGATARLLNADVTMYIYSVSATDYAKLTSGTATAYDDYYQKSTVATAQSTGGTGSNGQLTSPTTTADANTTVYAAILVMYKDGDNKEWYLNNYATASINELGANASLTNLARYLGGSSTNGAIGNWTAVGAVPEPTSGLLMLLGMAGLALKRRRA